MKQNKNVLDQQKGAGYWLWKPYVITRVLKSLNDGEFLMYVDADARFVASVDHFIRILETKQEDYLFFRQKHNQSDWTKRDTFVLMGTLFYLIVVISQVATFQSVIELNKYMVA